MVDDGTISGKIGKDILPDLLAGAGGDGGEGGKSPREIVEQRGLSQISDPAAGRRDFTSHTPPHRQ
jgi:aspartyl-tRNA(Asn)/glutamyl-tRNA(Gln) amidotransferase subunit B